jgi:hypothetical protein
MEAKWFAVMMLGVALSCALMVWAAAHSEEQKYKSVVACIEQTKQIEQCKELFKR